MSPVTLDELKQVYALKEAPDTTLQWLLDHIEIRQYEDGDCIVKSGEPVDHMWFIVEGKASFYMNINGKLVYYFTFENDPTTGGLGGVLPYSRLKKAPGNSYAIGTVRMAAIHRDLLPELEHLDPVLTQRLIGFMTDRARWFATVQLQQEKVNALGQLSAGIAHELNNPASAISRTSAELNKRLMLNYELTRKLLEKKVNAENIRVVHDIVGAKSPVAAQAVRISPMKRIELEDGMSDWLAAKHVDQDAPDAAVFVDAGLSTDDLERIHTSVGADAFVPVLHWMENLLTSERLLKDVEDASNRISHLVTAIKSHVHMDRTSDAQPTNINLDIDNTLTLLGHKLRQKNITVNKVFTEDDSTVEAYIGELNQVWTNIIDNAIYAAPQGGEITIKTANHSKDFIVRIIDNGPGIPPDVKPRIFDPFFTTKKVGEGTGIGLDTVARIVKRHNGEIKVYSEPGKTEFMVCLPVKQPATDTPVNQAIAKPL